MYPSAKRTMRLERAELKINRMSKHAFAIAMSMYACIATVGWFYVISEAIQYEISVQMIELFGILFLLVSLIGTIVGWIPSSQTFIKRWLKISTLLMGGLGVVAAMVYCHVLGWGSTGVLLLVSIPMIFYIATLILKELIETKQWELQMGMTENFYSVEGEIVVDRTLPEPYVVDISIAYHNEDFQELMRNNAKSKRVHAGIREQNFFMKNLSKSQLDIVFVSTNALWDSLEQRGYSFYDITFEKNLLTFKRRDLAEEALQRLTELLDKILKKKCIEFQKIS